MKILVTVGTTTFNSLVDKALNLKKVELVIQHADESFVSHPGVTAFNFIEDIEPAYERADIIITHAGAGSVYRLLELRKKILVVPNLERVDKHQVELAKFVENHNYGVVCWNLDELDQCLIKLINFEPINYVSNPFFKFDEIADYLNG